MGVVLQTLKWAAWRATGMFRASNPSAHPRDPVVAAWWGSGGATAAGVNVTPDVAMRQSAVFACVRVLAETLAAVPLKVYRRLDPRGKEVDRDHRLWTILHDRPNAWQTSFEFREMLMGHVALRGNGYAEIIATGGDPVAQLVPLHPDRVMPFQSVPGGQLAYRYTPLEGASRIILQEEMFHVRGLSSDGIVGLSPIALHRETIGSAIAAQEYSARFMANDSTPLGVVEMPKTFGSEDDRKAWIKSWQEAHSGVNRGRVAVLEDGMEYKTIGMTHTDAQYIESRKLDDQQIARIFRIQPHKIGILDNATFSNIEHQGLEFLTDTMMPWFVRWEQAIHRDLFTEGGRRTHFAAFDLKAFMRGDSKARSAFYASARQWGWMSANDIRELEDMNPIDGGDVYLSPSNMTPADQLAKQLEDLNNGTQD